MDYSNCKWCGSRLPEKARKCENCGKPVKSDAAPLPPQRQQTQAPIGRAQRARSRYKRQQQPSLAAKAIRRVGLAIGLFVLVIVGMGVRSYLQYRGSDVSEAPAPGTQETVQIPTEQLKSPDPKMRMEACATLNKIKPPTPEVVTVLIEMLKDPDANVRSICNHFAGELAYKGANAVPALIENLRHEAMNVRITSADALGQIGSELSEETRILEPLIVAMQDPEPFVRRSACWSLKKLGFRAETAMPSFQKGASDSSVEVQKCSLDAIADLSKQTLDVTPFVNALQSAQAETRSTAAAALAKAGPGARRAIPALARLLNDPDEYVRESVVDALGTCCIESGETAGLLSKALNDPSHSVRKYAVLHLGDMGPKARVAVPGLIKILSGQEIYLRVWAAQALGNIGPEAMSALPRLYEMKKERIESNEIEAGQLPGAVAEAIQKIEKRIY